MYDKNTQRDDGDGSELVGPVFEDEDERLVAEPLDDAEKIWGMVLDVDSDDELQVEEEDADETDAVIYVRWRRKMNVGETYLFPYKCFVSFI